MQHDMKLFAKRLRYFRAMARLKQVELGQRAGISASYISYLENGQKVPALSVVLALADALGLQAEDRDKLLQPANFKLPSDFGSQDALAPVHDVFQDPRMTTDELDDLAKALREFVARWNLLRGERKKSVRKAIVPAAGWQARLLSPPSLERTLIHAAQEASNAGIKQLIVVVAREMPDSTLASLRGRFKLAVNRVVQEEPLGLGNAILKSKEHVGMEPFAVVLPDDIDPSGKTMSTMVSLYEANRKPVIAVNPGPLEPSLPEARYYGVAFLGKRLMSPSELRRVDGLSEKPQRPSELPSNSSIIVGRYVLTTEIFDELQNLQPNEYTCRYELTDALATLLRRQTILAYELKEKLLPLAPVRSVVEKLIDSIKNRGKLERVLDLTAKLLKDMDRI